MSKTPFSLVYDIESILNLNVGIKKTTKQQNQLALEFNLATTNELREMVEAKMEKSCELGCLK